MLNPMGLLMHDIKKQPSKVLPTFEALLDVAAD